MSATEEELAEEAEEEADEIGVFGLDRGEGVAVGGLGSDEGEGAVELEAELELDPTQSMMLVGQQVMHNTIRTEGALVETQSRSSYD